MVRYTGPKNKIARKFGANIFNRLRNPLVHKQNPPGMHGARRKKRSDYGEQLFEKQKLKACYGMITEKQLNRYYREAVRIGGVTADNLLRFLESRLDVVVYRLKLANTIFAAQQLVSHGHVLVNGKKVDIRSFQVRPGMKITLREKSRKIKAVSFALEDSRTEVPAYLEVNAKDFEGSMLNNPEAEQISLPLEVNVPVVCEFLAHTT